MNGYSTPEPGQIVRSKAGHDKGNVFFIVGILDDGYVLIADGDLRKVEKPKKKKIRHLQPYNKVSAVIAGKIKNGIRIENAELQKELDKSGAVALAIADQEEMDTNV